MTSRERLLTVLTGGTPDRTPVAPYVHSNVVWEWLGADADVVEGTIAFCERFGFDVILRNFNVRPDDDAVSTPDWRVTRSERVEGQNVCRITQVETPEGNLRKEVVVTKLTANQSVTAYREHYVKTPKDFELLRKYQPVPQAPDMRELRRAKALLGDRGIVAPWTFGVFNYMAELRDLQAVLMDFMEEPDFYQEMMAYCLGRLQAGLAPVLAEGLDMLSYTGNLASSTMVGPAFFEEFVLEHEKKLIDFIQERACGVIYHNCGDGSRLIDCYNRLAPCCYESMTEPPYADNSLAQCVQSFRQDITLMGNIDQIDFLRRATPGEVRDKTEEILRIAEAHSRFILGTSDFLEEGTPAENLQALGAFSLRR